tara:strand:- start:12707 stop:13333 length:627 start_codon:yes stop_codon:yes gene_type:complete
MHIDYSNKLNIENLNIVFTTDNNFPKIENKRTISMNQIHSNKIDYFRGEIKNNQSLDGLITSNKKYILEVSVADCMPIFIFDKKINYFGVIHVGWKGLASGIIENSIAQLRNNKFSLKEVNVFIGPSISQKNFEVKNDVMAFFNEKFSIVKNKKIFLSLQGIAIDKFSANGVKNIINIDECTYDNNDYHSFRRNKTNKRMKGRIFYNE